MKIQRHNLWEAKGMNHKQQGWAVFTLILLMLLTSCVEQPTSVYDEDNPDPYPPNDIVPTITSILPRTGHFKEIVSIYGSGFSNNPSDNLVLFKNILGGDIENTIGDIVFSSNTLIQVETPDLSEDTIDVIVTSVGSVYFSDEYSYVLGSPIDIINEDIENVCGVAADSSFNVYIGSRSDSAIYQINSEGLKSVFATLPVDGVIEFGPAGELYVCQEANNKIVRVSPDGLTITDVVNVPSPLDFDWDASGNMFIVSRGQGVYYYDGVTLSDTLVSLTNPISCRIFENYFYVTDDKQILRYDLNGSELSNQHELKKMLATAYGLDVDAEGRVYSTNTRRNRIYQLTDTSEVLLFKNELMRPIDYLTYFKRGIYISTAADDGVSKVMRGHVGINAAPNYGRDS